MAQIETESLIWQTINPYHDEWVLPSNVGQWNLLSEGEEDRSIVGTYYISHVGAALLLDVSMTMGSNLGVSL